VARVLALAGVAALLVVAVMTTLVVRERSSEPKPQDVAGVVPDAFLRAEKFEWTQVKAGEPQWTLSARDATYAGDRRSVTLTDADLKLTSDDGKPVSVAAPSAVLWLDGNQIERAELSGGTIIRYDDFELTTERATFLPGSSDFDAPGPVTLVGDGLKITGVGLSGNARTRKFQLREQVTTEIDSHSEAAEARPG
jgi:lipopolysaccharide export system protein LptC